jgi:hypothetical protein
MNKIDEYRGWNIYYSADPRPLWKASKGTEKDLFSYFSLAALKEHIDDVEDKRNDVRVHK